MRDGADAQSVVARVLLLKRFPMFSELSPPALTALAEHVVEEAFAPGQAVSLASGPHVHFVLEGEVDSWKENDDVERVQAGSVLGEVEVLAAAPAALSNVRAATAVRTLRADREGLVAAQEESFPLQRALLKRLAGIYLEARLRRGWGARSDNGGSEGAIPENPQLAHRVAWLRGARLLRGLPIRTLGHLAAESEIISLRRGETLWKEGDAADFAVQILRGSLRCRGGDLPDFEVGPDDSFGLAEALADERRWCEATASADSLMIRVGIEDLLDELEDDFEVAVELMSTLAADVDELRRPPTSSDADAERPG